MTEQGSLFADYEPPRWRVQSLAMTISGYQWPERGSFEKLTKSQKEHALSVARQTLIEMHRGPE